MVTAQDHAHVVTPTVTSMYLIKQVPADPKLLEMSFDCSNFQYQLKEANKPQQDHIFQSIFLNKKNQDTWTMDEIDKDKISESETKSPCVPFEPLWTLIAWIPLIVRKDWWHQLEHRWSEFCCHSTIPKQPLVRY